MRRVVTGAMLFLTFAGIATADPALGAGRDLFFTHDARTEEDGALVFASRWLFRDTLGLDGHKYSRGPLYGMEMAYSPFPFVEVNGSVLGVNQFRFWKLDYDWQGFGVGGKLSFPYLPVVKLGVSGNWFIEDAQSRKFPGFLDDMVNKSGYWRGILAFRFWDLYKTLPTLIFNYGRNFDGAPTSLLSAGLELPSDAVDYFIEAVSQAKVTQWDDFFLRPTQATITPGVRVKLGHLHLNAGMVFGITKPFTTEVIAGFTIVSPFPKPRPRPSGQFAGRVEDALTGQPLAATLRYLNRRDGELQTDPANGTFYTGKSPVGSLLVEVSADGYLPLAEPVSISDHELANHIFRMRRAVPVGTIAGRVYDLVTDQPVPAAVTIDLPHARPVTAAARTGFFRLDSVPVGIYTVTFERDGYVREQRLFEVKEGSAATIEIGLKSMVMTGTFKGRVTDINTGAGIAATISFPGSRQPDLPTRIGAGNFQVELAPGAYDLRIASQNYQSLTAHIAIDRGDVLEQEYKLTPVVSGAAVPMVDTSKKLIQPSRPGVLMTLRGVLFDFDRSELRPEARPALLQAAEVLKQNATIRVEVQGHTDAIGSENYNMGLSLRRAQSVVDYLVSEGGIDRSRMVVRGYGKTMPVATNETPEGRQLNRRVDFVVIK